MTTDKGIAQPLDDRDPLLLQLRVAQAEGIRLLEERHRSLDELQQAQHDLRAALSEAHGYQNQLFEARARIEALHHEPDHATRFF